jgi:hypothetical protein
LYVHVSLMRLSYFPQDYRKRKLTHIHDIIHITNGDIISSASVRDSRNYKIANIMEAQDNVFRLNRNAQRDRDHGIGTRT